MNWNRTVISRIALLCVALIAGLGPGCSKLEQLDRQSDELLNKINDPSRSSSGRSYGQRASGQRSGLIVVERKAMPMRILKDKQGNPVKLWGKEKSTSKTPGHDMTIAAEAVEMARSGKYEYITMQRSWRTATGRVGTSSKIPDIIGVRYDGKVDAVEVQSRTDSEGDLRKRLRLGMATLPPERRGEYNVIQPNSGER